MTYQQIQWNIARAAADAAVASFDAHGHAVPAETAWEFLHQVASDDEGVYDYMHALPAAMPRQFAIDYATVCEARENLTTKARSEIACEVAHWAGDVVWAMISDEKIRKEYFARTGRQMSDDDLAALKRMAAQFHATELGSYGEMKNRIIEGMQVLADEFDARLEGL